MTTPVTDYRHGIRKTSALVSVTVPNSGTALYTLSAGRTAVVRKLHIFNNNAANGIVRLGTGLAGAFVAAMPGWFVVAGQDLWIREEDLEAVEFTANITVSSSVAAVAPNDILITIEVEEYQGPTG